jgi:hypothetical protein
VLALLVLWVIVSETVPFRRYGACMSGYFGVAGRALTLVGSVKPGNVDAVDLVHSRDSCLRRVMPVV